MRRPIAMAGVLAIALGYGGTWLWARNGVHTVIVGALKSQVTQIWRDHGSNEPIPQIDAEILWEVPVFPGVLLVTYYPTMDGHGPCIDNQAIVVWYGLGAKAFFRSV